MTAEPAPSAAQRPTVAAFDFDGTLTRGGSVLPFLIAVRGVAPTTVAVLRSLPGLIRGALFGGSAADQTKEGLFTQLLSGLPAQEVDRLAVDFAERHLRRRIRRDTRDRLDWHRKQGHRVVVVSASPELYVGPAAQLLGADAALGTRLAVSGRLLTGRYEGKNCRGPEKFARLAGWLRAEGLNGTGPNAPILWAYGNSRGDLRLLQAADHGVDAGQLGRFGRLRGYPRLDAVVAEAPGLSGAPTSPGEPRVGGG